MEAIAPRVPWWYFALAAVVMTAALGALIGYGFGRPLQVGVVLFVLLALITFVRRAR